MLEFNLYFFSREVYFESIGMDQEKVELNVDLCFQWSGEKSHIYSKGKARVVLILLMARAFCQNADG